MKNIFILSFLCLCQLNAFPQFTLKGFFANTGEHKYAYLYKIKDTKNDVLLVDSIRIGPDQGFSYVLKDAKRGELYKLVQRKVGDVEEFPENALLFSAEPKTELAFSAGSINELYNVRLLKATEAAKNISGKMLGDLAPYFQIVAGIKEAPSENERAVLFQKIMKFQQDYISSLHTIIANSTDAEVLTAGLYFLAKFYQGSGQGNFKSYYNTVQSLLPVSDLTENFRKRAAETPFKVDVKNILALSLDSIVGNRSTNFSRLLTKKYILVDFWASWCGACRNAIRNEIPGLVKKYKTDPAFSIVSVSVDTDVAKWTKASAEDKISWANYRVNNTNKSPIPDFLSGTGLPYYILLSDNGDILFSSGSLIEMKERMKLYR